MNISYNWLKEYVSFDLSPEKVAEILTFIGLEVEEMETVEDIPGGLEGVVVAQVLECVPHPDSDHLHITKVLAAEGDEPLQVVWRQARKCCWRRSVLRCLFPTAPS